LHTALADAINGLEDHFAVLDDAIQASFAPGAQMRWQKLPIYFSGRSKKLVWGSEQSPPDFA